MEALQTKGGFLLYLFSGWLKNSAKSVTVAHEERHLAQLGGAPASSTARF
jgi:hypothetical protein